MSETQILMQTISISLISLTSLSTVSALGSRNAIEYVLDDLLHYTADHFRREELHMEAMAYPHLERHKKMHLKLTDRVRQVRWQYQNGLLDNLCEETLTFLMDWLVSHIKHKDQTLLNSFAS